MHVRMNTIFGERGQTTAVLDYLEGLDRPAVESIAGNGGLMTFADEDRGIIVAASYWDEPDHSSAAALTDVRRGAEAIARGMVISTNYEVRALVQRAAARRGAAVRLDWLQLDEAGLDDAVELLSQVLLTELSTREGLCSAEILVNSDACAAIVSTVWDTERAADSGDAAIEGLRGRAADHGATFVSVERYTLMGVSPHRDVSATA